MGSRLILVEGIPGSGKSTLARWLEARLSEAGWRARSHEELAEPHPVVPRALRRTCRQPGYALRCAESWSQYADACRHRDGDEVDILEACLFQGTVRLMLEYEVAPDEIRAYVDRTLGALDVLRPVLILLRQADARGFFETKLVARKGVEIVDKIAAHTETTPLARRHGWTGRAGMARCYAHYRDVCDGLLADAELPTHVLDSGGEDWPAIQRSALAFVSSELGLAAARG